MFSWCAKTVAFLCVALYRDIGPSAPELQSVPESDSNLLFFLCKSSDLIMVRNFTSLSLSRLIAAPTLGLYQPYNSSRSSNKFVT